MVVDDSTRGNETPPPQGNSAANDFFISTPYPSLRST
jgi:hypothetical protein